MESGKFRDVASEAGGGFDLPKVGRGLAFGDFDRDGDLDLLMTTNHGPAFLFRNDVAGGNRSVRFRLVGKKSNADGIGAVVRIFYGGVMQSRMVRGGSSYLSQSELPVTFGVGRRDRIERVVIEWPSGRSEEFKDLVAGKAYVCTETVGDEGGVERQCKATADWLCTESVMDLHYCRDQRNCKEVPINERLPNITGRHK